MTTSNHQHGGTAQFVTVRLGGQLLGLPIEKVQDVFLPDNFTKVPLARPQIAGVLNLRGRIVTIIDLAKILKVEAINHRVSDRPAVGVICANESYGLLTDSVGEVVTLNNEDLQANPINMHASWSKVSLGTYRMESELLVVINVDELIEGLLKREAA